MKKILIDTNAYTSFLAGDTHVLDILGGTDIVYMSVIVLGELYAGFRGGSREKENKSTLVEFLSKPTIKILNVTSNTAEVFGVVKNNLKSAGTPIPISDVWIASHGIETGAMVVTYDSHFKYVPGLILWDYEMN